VSVKLTARLGPIQRVLPQRGTQVTRSARFTVVFPKGLPRAGRYRVRLTAAAGGKRQCLDQTIRIRARARR
jgi:hypothetical protein